MQYLIILLDSSSTSYCHCENKCQERQLILIEELKKGIFFAMKENLMIQFVYPDYMLPQAYKDVIDSIDSNSIVSSLCEDKRLLTKAEIVVFHEWTGLDYFAFNKQQAYVLRTMKADFFDRYVALKSVFSQVSRFNVVITDVESFTNEDYNTYKQVLSFLSEAIFNQKVKGNNVAFNLLTDRIDLLSMNNCNAGWKNITLAPDGKFYVCPAFYYDGLPHVGDLMTGINIPNSRLFKLDYAPICRHCDSYQCKRCVWLNKKTTLEVNTPSHEQCVIAHLERNASRNLLAKLQEQSLMTEKSKIPSIDYLDPFDVRELWDAEFLQKELIKFHNENY